MSGIRFVHVDHLRLASPVTGLDAAPEWLRRQARDASRQTVINLCDLAQNRDVDFVLIAGRLAESADDIPRVLAWLREPLGQLRRRGIKVAITADDWLDSVDVSEVCDVVIRSGERLDADRQDAEIRLDALPAGRTGTADVTVGFRCDSGSGATSACHYLISPAVHRRVMSEFGGDKVYSAGALQALHPNEEGPFGCLLVDTDPGTGRTEVTFEATDVLRFATETIRDAEVHTADDVSSAVLSASQPLARMQTGTLIVDWRIERDVKCSSSIADFSPAEMLHSVRNAMQKGYLGVWPRRVDVVPRDIELLHDDMAASLLELASVLSADAAAVHSLERTHLAELAKGAQLLRAA